MPLIPIALALLVVVALILAMSLTLVQRYRGGKARRLGRKWLATVNIVTMFFSSAVFVWVAALTNLWVRNAFLYSIIGLAGGSFLGLFGLALTRWETTATTLHYTPNRWLILLLTLAITARLLYGLWRGWHAWGATPPGTSWLGASGAAGSLAVGAVVLGYYLTYSLGVYRQVTRRRQQTNG